MKRLSQIEEEIIAILWEIGEGYPKEILAQFTRSMPYNTFLSTIRKMETEGWLAYKKYGRSHKYYPLVLKDDYKKSLYKNLKSKFFGGSRQQLLSFFLEEEKIDKTEIEKLLKQIEENHDWINVDLFGRGISGAGHFL